MSVKQIKLTNDDEVICNVLEWNSEETDEVVVKQALKIIGQDDIENGMRYFTLKPWMSLSTNLNELQTLNSMHIVAIANPSKSALEYYEEVLQQSSDLNNDIEIIDPFEYDISYDSDNTISPLIH